MSYANSAGVHFGNVFSAAFTASLTTTDPRGLISVLASSLSRVQILEFVAGVTSTASAVTQSVGVTFLRGSTAVATGSAITPINHVGWTAAKAAGSSVSGNSTALLSSASAVLLWADAMQDGHVCYKPAVAYAPILEAAQRLDIRISGPAAQPITVNGTLTFAEIGKNPT